MSGAPIAPIVSLPEYLDDLRKNNKLLPTDFTEEDRLEALTKEFAGWKGLSAEAKTKLNIKEIIRRVGLTLEDDNKHVRYATSCELDLNDGTNVTVTAMAPPDSSTYSTPDFMVSKAGSPPTAASTVAPESKKFGFRALPEAVLITPVSPDPSDTVLAYRYDHGVPLVDRQPSGVLGGAIEANFSWELTQYCVFNPDKPDDVGPERFIFTGYGKGSSKLQGYYMRVEDLKRRLESGNAAVSADDLDRLAKGDALYPLWNPKGELQTGIYAKVPFNVFDPKDNGGGDKKTNQIKSLFLIHCGIARQARFSDGLYDVLGRFWDAPWDESAFVLQINIAHQKAIREAAKKLVTDQALKNLKLPQFAVIADEDKPLMVLIEKIKEDRQFKPDIVAIEWRPDPQHTQPTSVPSMNSKWGSHPNDLYGLWMNQYQHVRVIDNKKTGVWLPDRDWVVGVPAQAADKMIQDNMKAKRLSTYRDVNAAVTTTTKVTRAAVNITKSYKRKPDQVGAMGGTSPNELVKPIWKLKDGEKAAEWLHRSAWSFGGLDQGGAMDPQSSQVMYNLMIGTSETNTMMIRHEIFVKRVAQYAKDKTTGKGVQVQVKTKLQKFMEEAPPEYGWATPRLTYEVKTLGDPDVPVDGIFNFYPFQRRLPTRLEIALDELFETLAYSWGGSDFLA
ncbi:hypothetical protein FRC17_009715 [Serendipita sp. 399]|nr:hypothetical protein FRC17_009715 [Serendipita sp. 399]